MFVKSIYGQGTFETKLFICTYILQIVQSLKNEDEDVLSGEQNELTKDVFFMLKLPYDVQTDKERLQQILNRRKRKIGLTGSRRRISEQFSNPDRIPLQVINEP